MAAVIELRGDFTGDDLRRLARSSRDAKQVRRLLALAAICDGGTRTEAARIGGVGLQIVRDWVVRFNAEGPDGLIDRKASGKAPTLTPAQRAALAGAVEAGPEPWRDGVVRWRLIDLVQWLWEEFRVSVSAATVGRELRALGFRKLSARPRHYAQDPEAAEAFKKSPGAPGGSPGCPSGQAHRALVAGRGKGRPEEQAHPEMGAARDPAARAARPAHCLGLSLRRDLPRRGQGRRAGHAVLRHASDAGASRRDQRHGRAGCPRRSAPRPGRMASRRGARRAQEHHALAASAPLARAQSRRKRLAVPARQLPLEPRLQSLRRHRRPLLRRME